VHISITVSDSKINHTDIDSNNDTNFHVLKRHLLRRSALLTERHVVTININYKQRHPRNTVYYLLRLPYGGFLILNCITFCNGVKFSESRYKSYNTLRCTYLHIRTLVTCFGYLASGTLACITNTICMALTK
jgi:hypothetical protein